MNNQSNRLSCLGRQEEALATVEEAVQIHRTLAEARPDSYLPNLATALNNQSNHLSGLERQEEALAAIEEATDLYRTLAEARPDAFLSDLARSWAAKGMILLQNGNAVEATTSCWRA